jgi:long-chain acyl-CoA synthetase
MWKMPQTINELFQRNVNDFPDREAFTSVSYTTGEWVRHSWKELDEISDRLAAGLTNLGVKKGRKVGFMLTNSAECYYTYLAIHKIGAVFVPINVRLVPREVEYIVENSEAEFFIAGHEFLPLVEQARDRLNAKVFVGIEQEKHDLPDWATPYSQLLKTADNLPEIIIDPEDTADIIYTSGTTGLPKGVVLTQANKVACGRMLGGSLGFRRLHSGVPRLQNVFPFFTSSGCSSVMMMWLYYAPVVILEPVFDVITNLEIMAKERPTVYGGAPAMFVFMLNHPRFKEFDTSSLRCVMSGASAMPEEVIRSMQGIWPGIKIYNTYLLTEGGTGGTVLDASDAMTKLGSSGLPLVPDQELRVVDQNDKDMTSGDVGEIIIRGPNVMKEYYKNPEATRKTIKDGWLYTGDMGYCDEDGYLYFTDRLKDMIVRGGFNVYSVEVESALYEHPAVKQCAVVGKPHASLGEDIVAFVVLKEGESVTGGELNEFTADRLADYKRPRDIRFIDALPINPTGKVDKKIIRSKHI